MLYIPYLILYFVSFKWILLYVRFMLDKVMAQISIEIHF